MTEPVLVVHGVNNHDFAPFRTQVDALRFALGDKYRLIPVYWGDLGGQSKDLPDCLPLFVDGTWRVRSKDGALLEVDPQIVRALQDVERHLDNVERAEVISGQLQSESLVRSSPQASLQKVRDVVAAELDKTHVLQHVDDHEMLAIVGRVIDAVLGDLPAHDAEPASAPAGDGVSVGDYSVRSPDAQAEELDTRGVLDPLKRITGHVVSGIDEALGRFVGNRLGRLNQSVRTHLAAPISATLGDIMAYQRQPTGIQERMRAEIERQAPGYGSEGRPISVVAHSLGGVIAFDAAVNPPSDEKRLWIKSFVTFGSQPAFFHIVDPREPLNRYARDAAVTLPTSIGKWINLWDPMDLLAFTAGTVFRLATGERPEDIAVRSSASDLVAEKGWTHSVYWTSDELLSTLKRSLS